MATQQTEKRAVKGSCLCGNIKYEADLPAGPITANRCNCAFCRKRGMTTLMLSGGPSDFHVLQPANHDLAPKQAGKADGEGDSAAQSQHTAKKRRVGTDDEDDDAGIVIGDYNPAGKQSGGSGHRYFCKTCGVHVWMTAQYEIQGRPFDMFAINLATVDQPQEGIDLSEVKIMYVDGLNDKFMPTQREGAWPGGLI